MNLRSLDLNLLVVLDALLDEAHVGRAAERIGLSQPAASAALQRCRHLFRDALLERGRGVMRLTPRAQALRAPLKSLLAEVAALVDTAPVPLHELRQTLRIVMTDYPALFVLAPLAARLRDTAPGLDLVVQPWLSADAARRQLAEGSADLAISVFAPGEDGLGYEHLLDEHYVVAMRPDHPAAAGFDRSCWLASPHIVVSGRGERTTPVDEELARRGLARRVGLVVPGFQMVPILLRQTDMMALLPSRVAAAEAGLVTFPPPVPVPGFPLHLAWHRRRDGDAGLRHVAALLVELLRTTPPMG
ncbi:DNA-binding transcriptional LysR family regulator [Ancylobacter sp. 3268]|uniref:LysR family transcriptional regulator n=1 Tax=Ancylobacter sp. 3268 TaxID=2817752 RepID=UPI0028649062|nr:LysR family transcriptional regulator [Ancylobacter sp. 3268]MDR6953917.1 DNA-binding transcriptional LysR family regulator [Ancylobacter sp. 3268]